MASVTLRNIVRNICVTERPGKGRERNVVGISPLRGIPDVTPMPRNRDTAASLVTDNVRFHGGDFA